MGEGGRVAGIKGPVSDRKSLSEAAAALGAVLCRLIPYTISLSRSAHWPRGTSRGVTVALVRRSVPATSQVYHSSGEDEKEKCARRLYGPRRVGFTPRPVCAGGLRTRLADTDETSKTMFRWAGVRKFPNVSAICSPLVILEFERVLSYPR